MKHVTIRVLALLIALMLAVPGFAFAEAPVDGASVTDDAAYASDLSGDEDAPVEEWDDFTLGDDEEADDTEADPQAGADAAPVSPAAFDQSVAVGAVTIAVTAGAGAFPEGSVLQAGKPEDGAAQAAKQAAETALEGKGQLEHHLFSIEVLDAAENPSLPDYDLELPRVKLTGLEVSGEVHVLLYDPYLEVSYELDATADDGEIRFAFVDSSIYDVVGVTTAEAESEDTSSVSPDGEPASPQGEAFGNESQEPSPDGAAEGLAERPGGEQSEAEEVEASDDTNTNDEANNGDTSSVSPDGEPASPQGEAFGDAGEEVSSPDDAPDDTPDTPDATNTDAEADDQSLDDASDGSLSEGAGSPEGETEGVTDPEADATDDDASDEGASDEGADEEAVPFEQSQTVAGVVVTVRAEPGAFPEGAALSVKRVPVYKARQADAAIDEVRDEDQNVAVSYTFDIKVMLDGEELQPADGYGVEVSFALEEAGDANLEANVYHIEEEHGALTAEKLDTDVDENTETVTALSDGFSLYTVEFTYNDLEYVLEGGESVALSDILFALGLTGTAEQVVVSDASLFSASDASGEWVIESHKPFSTTEWMKVWIDGIKYEITVTDDQQITTWAELQTALNAGGTVMLTQDLTAGVDDAYLSITTGKSVTLDLNGHTLDAAENINFVFYINGTNAQLTLTGDGTVTGATESGVYIDSAGTFIMTGGTITGNGNENNGQGGGVHLESSTFEMSGGEITGNKAGSNGGGVYVDTNGTFRLSGAPVIKGNTVNNGSANNVYLATGKTITISGELNDGTDIGVSMQNPGTFTSGKSFPSREAARVVFTSDNLQYAYINLTSTGQATLTIAEVLDGEKTDEYASLGDAVNAWNSAAEGATLRLLAEVTTGSTINVYDKKTLDLNGYGIRISGEDSVIRVYSGGKLTLTDGDTSRTHYITLEQSGRGTNVSDNRPESGKYIEVSGGYITGGYGENNNGGGVVVDSVGTLTMEGGTICGNAAQINGGGVIVNGGGSFTMNDGTISGNTASYGGGVHVFESGAFTMTGGTISGNTAFNNGGGVFVQESGTFTVSGAPVITDNKKGTAANSSDDNVFLGDDTTGKASAIIAVDSAKPLTKGAQIGVSMAVPGVFTKDGGFTGREAVRQYFSSDDKAVCEAPNLSTSQEATLAMAEVKNTAGDITSFTTIEGNTGAFASCDDTIGDFIFLLTDVTTKETVSTGDRAITLDLNGYGILMTGDGSVISVEDGGSLTLENSVGEQQRKYYITLGADGRGTKVSGEKPESGEYIEVTDGYITGGTGDYGGGVFVGGPFTMKGGTICGNVANAHGGGVYVNPDGTFTMTGGAITGNTAKTSGGGVFAEKADAINVSGAPKITDNKAGGKAGNVYLQRNRTIGVDGKLQVDARIGVTVEDKPDVGNFVTLTSGYKDNVNPTVNTPRTIFTSDDTTYAVDWEPHNNEAVLGVAAQATATDYEGVYDGEPHSITVKVTTPESGATVQYCQEKTGDYQTKAIEFTDVADAQNTDVYYRAGAKGYVEARGSATVTINPLDVKVTITGKTDTATYDGEAHKAEGYGFKASSALYKEDYASFTGDAEARRTDVGTTWMRLAASQFKNESPNFNATFAVTDGALTIKPQPVTLTANGAEYTYDGDAKTVTGFTCSVDGLTFANTVKASGKGTNAGAYPVTFTGVTLDATTDTTGNYVVTKVEDGTLTINPQPVTLTANGAEYTYDGDEKTVTGFTCSVDGLKFADVKARGKGTEVGEYPVTFTGVTLNATKDATGNYVVTKVEDGTMTINPEPITPDITQSATMKPAGNKAVHLGWAKVDGAQGYDVFFKRCDGKGGYPLSKTIADPNAVSHVISGLKKGKAYKAYVKAWKMKDGKKTYIGEPTPTVHCIAGGYTKKWCNAKSVKVKQSSKTLAPGKTWRIKGSVKGVKKGRKVLRHVKKLRFYSSDRNVATVNANGVVTAMGVGTCQITVMANNGVSTNVKITVSDVPTAIRFRKSSYSVKKGKTLKLATSKRLKVTPASLAPAMTWTSNRPDIASVSADGTVKGIRAGTAIITVTTNGKRATVKVRVK